MKINMRMFAFLAGVAFISGTSFAQEQPSSSAGATVFREPFALNLRVDRQHSYENHSDRVPYVAENNDVSIFPGEKFGVSLTITKDTITTATYEPSGKHADVELDFKVDKSSSSVMWLIARNTSKHDLVFDADVTKPAGTKTLVGYALPAQSSIFLVWSDPILRLDLRFSMTPPSVWQEAIPKGRAVDFRRLNACRVIAGEYSVRSSLATGPIKLSPVDRETLFPTVWREYLAGQTALEAGDLNKAKARLKKAIEWASIYCHDQTGPYTESLPIAHEVLGQTYLQQKKYKEAKAEFQSALRLTPKSGAALIGLGTSLNRLNDYAGALTALCQGLQVASEYYPGRYELAMAHVAQGDWQAAKPHVEQVLAESPNFAAAHELMGRILVDEGHSEDALKEFDAYLKLEPNGPKVAAVRQSIAEIHAKKQKLQEKK